MLPAGMMTKAIQLCAAVSAGASAPAPSFPVTVHAGVTLSRQPTNVADAAATVRNLLALGADFDAGPLRINGRDFATWGVSPASAFDPCALARIEDDAPAPSGVTPTVSNVTALLRRAFGARITDTIRPMNASYGALHSWHKVAQAVDFVPAGGPQAISREAVRTLMAAHGIHLIELLGPGDRGHANHWHVAFARAGQIIDQTRPIEGEEDWIINVAANGAPAPIAARAGAPSAPAPASDAAKPAPPSWDVFAAAQWRATHGVGS